MMSRVKYSSNLTSTHPSKTSFLPPFKMLYMRRPQIKGPETSTSTRRD